MTIKIIIHSLLIALLSGYAVLALYLVVHGAYVYLSDRAGEDEARLRLKESGYKLQQSERDVFIYTRNRVLRQSRGAGTRSDGRQEDNWQVSFESKN